MQSTGYSCQILMKLWPFSAYFREILQYQISRKTSSRSRVVPWGETDMTKLLVVLSNFVEAPKNSLLQPHSEINPYPRCRTTGVTHTWTVAVRCSCWHTQPVKLACSCRLKVCRGVRRGIQDSVTRVVRTCDAEWFRRRGAVPSWYWSLSMWAHGRAGGASAHARI